MSYVLMVGPRLIPTDGMIYKGSQYLLQQAGVCVDEYQMINDHKEERMVPRREPTHIIVMGTPWVWDQCDSSYKYSNLAQLRSHYPNAKTLFLGVGSCFPLGKTPEMLEAVAKLNLKPVFEGATVITRDRAATEALKAFNPTILTCPAYYALYDSTDCSLIGNCHNVAIWYDPRRGISKVDYEGLDNNINMKNYVSRFKFAVADKSDVKMYCIEEHERDSAVEYGFERPTLIQDIQHAELILRSASSVVSGRVHMAVPALGHLGVRRVELISVDSRGSTLDYARANSAYVGQNRYTSLLSTWFD